TREGARAPAPTLFAPRSLNSTKVGRKPARVLPPPVGAISSTERPARARDNNSNWWARGVQPREENQREKFSGSSGASSIFFARLKRIYFPDSAFFTKLSL